MTELKRQSFRQAAGCIIAFVIFVLVYVSGSLGVWSNARITKQLTSGSVTNGMVVQAIGHPLRHDSDFFRIAATKLEFAPHNPAVLRRAYQLAVIKAPANWENLLSFARYASARGELDQAEKLFAGAARRYPTSAWVSGIAGITLFTAGRRSSGLQYLKGAMELNPGLSWDIYPIIHQNGATTNEIIQVTPRKTEAMIRLCDYLVSRRMIKANHLQVLLMDVIAMKLERKQMLKIAEIAMRGGVFSLARGETEKLLDDPEARGEAQRLLQEIETRERKRR